VSSVCEMKERDGDREIIREKRWLITRRQCTTIILYIYICERDRCVKQYNNDDDNNNNNNGVYSRQRARARVCVWSSILYIIHISFFIDVYMFVLKNRIYNTAESGRSSGWSSARACVFFSSFTSYSSSSSITRLLFLVILFFRVSSTSSSSVFSVFPVVVVRTRCRAYIDVGGETELFR